MPPLLAWQRKREQVAIAESSWDMDFEKLYALIVDNSQLEWALLALFEPNERIRSGDSQSSCVVSDSQYQGVSVRKM